MSSSIDVLKQKYVDLRVRLIAELDRVDERLAFYADLEKDKQTLLMEKKYLDRQEKLIEELDKVDTRLQSYESMKKTQSSPEEESPKPQKTQKMYRGRPVA